MEEILKNFNGSLESTNKVFHGAAKLPKTYFPIYDLIYIWFKNGIANQLCMQCFIKYTVFLTYVFGNNMSKSYDLGHAYNTHIGEIYNVLDTNSLLSAE